MANLTRLEAQERSTRVNAESYAVTVDLTGHDLAGAPLADPTRTFVSRSVVKFRSAGGSDWLDLIADEVLELTVDGQSQDPRCFANSRVPLTVTEGDHEVAVTALCRYSNTGEGLHRFVDPADDRVYLYTQFETAETRRVFANFEQPDLKATFQFTIIAPSHWTICSNSPTPKPTALREGTAVWEFAPSPRMSGYIAALVAGEYHRVDAVHEGVAGPIPLGLLCRQSQVEYLDVDRILQTTHRGFEVFENAFDLPYPFGKYDQCFVPEFNSGAMENLACVTHRDDYLFRSQQTDAAYEGRDNTILHEMCHMWFGDLVTMKWWDDLWLNESFAEWGAHYAQGVIAERYQTDHDAWASFCVTRKSWAYQQDQLPTTHPIAADMYDLEAVELNFDGITYSKGASALRQLVAFVGEEAFLAAIRQYFKDHAYGNTELPDLLGALEKASGRDLSWFTSLWLEQAGVNTLRPQIECDADGVITQFAVLQEANEQWPTLRIHRIAIGLYNLVDGVLTRTERIETDIEGARTVVAEMISRCRPDMILLNDDDLTYTKIRLDEYSLTTLTNHIDKLDAKMARALCWGAAWDMALDAEMAAQDYTTLALLGLRTESNSVTVAGTLNCSLQALNTMVAPELRAATTATFTVGLLELLAIAEPGSDKQLSLARRVVSLTSDAQLLKDWLAGTRVPAGIKIENDLRWSIVSALARMNAIDDAVVATELEQDQTINGQEAAATARASFPTAEAKAEAWRKAAEDPSTPNGTQRAAIVGFQCPDHVYSLDAFVDTYFALTEEISAKSGIWATRSAGAGQTCVGGLFPMFGSPATLARIDTWLETALLTDAVARTVHENRDLLARHLRCQEASRRASRLN